MFELKFRPSGDQTWHALFPAQTYDRRGVPQGGEDGFNPHPCPIARSSPRGTLRGAPETAIGSRKLPRL